MLVGVAGVSGSGKSSLISNDLVEGLKMALDKGFRERGSQDGNLAKVVGSEHITSYCEVAQMPIGRNANSNPATYIGIWDKIRKLYAKQTLAVERGYSSGHFSFNSKGACEKCGGSGKETLWLGGNLKIEHTCEVCYGKRFNEASLEIKYKGCSIHDVLEMSIAQCLDFFRDEKVITPILAILDRIGMGYIKLGQPTSTLSGGEAQRIKLAKEIGKRKKGHVLYILDEPTTGLSMYDTKKLVELLDELVKKGHSVILIEHDIEVLRICDWLIELGPEGGHKGGHIIFEGTPGMMAADGSSNTGRYLK